MPLVGCAAWLGGVCGLLAPHGVAAVAVVVTLAAALLLLAARRRTARSSWRMLVALLLVAAGAAGVASLRVERVADNPVTRLATEAASVSVLVELDSDVHVVVGRFSDLGVVRATTLRVATTSVAVAVRVPVLVMADAARLSGVRIGSRVEVHGRLEPADDPGVSAVVRVFGEPRTVSRPAWWWRAADRLRGALRRSVAGIGEPQRVLVPALVVGDDRDLDPAVADQFRTTGLTHLLAVSGTNLTLLVGFVLWMARWVGVRGRWSYLVGVLGILGFVLLARPEPSVLRAAAMGSVGLVALGPSGRRRGGRALGVAVTVLLLADPWLATSPGFALSSLATGGIVFAGPVWRDALAAWLPRWAAEAIAVPAVAQLACTPIVAALSGQISLVAIGANLLAAPAVGPATVLGLAGGVVGLVADGLGAPLGHAAGWCVAWIVVVAENGAAVPLPAVAWRTEPGPLVVLAGASLLVLVAAPRALRRRALGVVLTLGLALVVVVRVPLPGWLPSSWPPAGWVVVACDVGQGDGLVLRAGEGTAVVVDTGPDAAAMDRCLRRLGVRSVPLVVLTHFHADHISGLAGVLHGRRVADLEVTALPEPADGADEVARIAGDAGLTPRVATFGEAERYGDVTLQVVSPDPGAVAAFAASAASNDQAPEEGSDANNASIVLVAEVRGVRILLTGDVEPEAQAQIARSVPGLQVEVLKVPHHGSSHQDLDWLRSLGSRVALVSVGADNDYGHPSAPVLDTLTGDGTLVLRTDLQGDLAVTVDGGGRVDTATGG